MNQDYKDGWRYIVWVGGNDDYYKNYNDAKRDADEWKAKGYDDVIIERIRRYKMLQVVRVYWNTKKIWKTFRSGLVCERTQISWKLKQKIYCSLRQNIVKKLKQCSCL